MKKIFDPHGQLDIILEDRILIVKGTDSPNSEMVKEYDLRVEEYYQILKGAPWGSLTYIKGDIIFPPDAAPMIETNFRRMLSLGLVGIAAIITETQYPSVVKNFWQATYEKSDIPHQFFDKSEDAKSWLLSRISQENRT
jgi:hypothetical protein